MYWTLHDHRQPEDEETYMLLARQATITPKPNSIVQTIATSKPVVAIDRFNRTFVDLIVSSLGFVAALSWNDFFKSLFLPGGPFHKAGGNGLLYVALFITVLAYGMTILVTTMYPEREVAKKPNPIEKSLKE